MTMAPMTSRISAKAILLAACLAAPLLPAAPALALVVTIPGTAQNTSKPSGTPGNDSAWQVVQLPSVVNASPVTGTPPYDAWIPVNIPAPWLGSGLPPGPGTGTDNNNGVTIGSNTYRWISPGRNAQEIAPCAPIGSPYATDPSTFIACPPGGPVSSYSYILRQDFTIPVAGNYVVNLGLTADNKGEVYINGLIDQTNTQNPIISGGTLIGTTDNSAGSQGRLTDISNLTYLNAGTNSAYIVVQDYQLFTGVVATEFTITTYDAPGPLPLFGAGAAFGWGRRLRRRLGAGSSPAPIR